MEEDSWTGTADEVVDESGMGNHGTAIGPIQTTAAGRFGRAGQFDGTGWIEVPDSESLHASTAVTISVWIWAEDLRADFYPGIVSKRTGYNDTTAYCLHIGVVNLPTVDIDGAADRVHSPTPLETSRWYHLAVVYDGSQPQDKRTRIYIDGTLDTTAPEASSSIPPYTSPLYVGNLPNGGDPFIGLIDEVGVWTRALEPEEILLLANNSVP